MDQSIEFTVNGKKRTVITDPQRRLLDVLREDLQLTGTKYGCGEGMCRACTVLLDGDPILSCMTPVSGVAGKSVTTIEGLARGDLLHPLQQAMLDEGKSQCGYCMPGMILQGAALLERNPHPSEEEIKKALNGSICRCGSHPAIIKAIQRASGQTAERSLS